MNETMKGITVGQLLGEMMKRLPQHQIEVAYHEAGHAVAAVVLDVPINQVTIKPDCNAYGHVQLIVPSVILSVLGTMTGRDRYFRAKSMATVFYGGYEAELLVNRNQSSLKRGASNDVEQAYNLPTSFNLVKDGHPLYIRGCKCLGDDAHLDWLWKRHMEARRIVRREKDAVDALVLDLLARENGTVIDVNAVVDRFLKKTRR
jgi:hypothetical protein